METSAPLLPPKSPNTRYSTNNPPMAAQGTAGAGSVIDNPALGLPEEKFKKRLLKKHADGVIEGQRVKRPEVELQNTGHLLSSNTGLEGHCVSAGGRVAGREYEAKTHLSTQGETSRFAYPTPPRNVHPSDTTRPTQQTHLDTHSQVKVQGDRGLKFAVGDTNQSANILSHPKPIMTPRNEVQIDASRTGSLPSPSGERMDTGNTTSPPGIENIATGVPITFSHRLFLAFKSKPTLTRTWEKKTFTEELRSAPLTRSMDTAEMVGGDDSNNRPTSLYASPAALRSFRPLPLTAPPSPHHLV